MSDDKIKDPLKKKPPWIRSKHLELTLYEKHNVANRICLLTGREETSVRYQMVA